MDNGQMTMAILTAATPTVTVLIALLVQRQDMRDLRIELQQQMIALRNQVHTALLLIHERVAKVEARQGS